jgi:hypothetical protein
MANPSYLRLTPPDYQALRKACEPLDLAAHPVDFRAALADALRPGHPDLAGRVARLRQGQVDVLLEHLQNERAPQQPADQPDSPPNEECELTAREWKAVWQACQVISLHDHPHQSFPVRLIHELSETAPELASRIGAFSPGQFGALLHRVKGGRRWCP